jgi:hypothetical protein
LSYHDLRSTADIEQRLSYHPASSPERQAQHEAGARHASAWPTPSTASCRRAAPPLDRGPLLDGFHRRQRGVDLGAAEPNHPRPQLICL